VQFVAVVASVDADTDELGMKLAPDFILPVFVTDTTDIRDANEDPLEGDDLMVGMILRVRGIFTGDGVLGEQIRVPIWRASLPSGALSKPYPKTPSPLKALPFRWPPMRRFSTRREYPGVC
jgi:hypothetical protein